MLVEILLYGTTLQSLKAVTYVSNAFFPFRTKAELRFNIAVQWKQCNIKVLKPINYLGCNDEYKSNFFYVKIALVFIGYESLQNLHIKYWN